MESLSSSSSSSFACHMTTVSNSSDHSSSASTCCSSRSSCSRRRVSFREVEIIELPMTVGDGPSLGVPLTVDWQPQDRSTFDIDFFEQFRPERRNKLQLRMGPESRERLLLKNGCTEEEILAGVEQASILRSDRRTTVHHLATMRQVKIHHQYIKQIAPEPSDAWDEV